MFKLKLQLICMYFLDQLAKLFQFQVQDFPIIVTVNINHLNILWPLNLARKEGFVLAVHLRQLSGRVRSIDVNEIQRDALHVRRGDFRQAGRPIFGDERSRRAKFKKLLELPAERPESRRQGPFP